MSGDGRYATSSGSGSPFGSSVPTIRVTTIPRPAVRTNRTNKVRRINAWFVRSIMLATTLFALIDLSLLVFSARH